MKTCFAFLATSRKSRKLILAKISENKVGQEFSLITKLRGQKQKKESETHVFVSSQPRYQAEF